MDFLYNLKKFSLKDMKNEIIVDKIILKSDWLIKRIKKDKFN